jgi:hypothetical protein
MLVIERIKHFVKRIVERIKRFVKRIKMSEELIKLSVERIELSRYCIIPMERIERSMERITLKFIVEHKLIKNIKS